LAMPPVDVARLLLAGMLRFDVDKRSPGRDLVLRMDVWVDADDVRALQRDRWDAMHGFRADELVNRAAMKFGKHPTRTSPGVRGPAKPKGREDG
jgi:hypothetical protein